MKAPILYERAGEEGGGRTKSSLKLGSLILITKGKKHSIADGVSSASKRLIGIDDLRNDAFIRFTDDKSGVDAFVEDILIAWDGANAGTIGFGKKGLIGSTIARLRLIDINKFYTPFLGTFLKSKFSYLRDTATGATIPHINRKALENIVVPQIPLDDQKRIAHLLGKVEGLIAQSKQHLQQLDDLLKSVFLEMFGDPVKNEKGWDINLCEKVVLDISSGTSYGGEDRAFESPNEVGVLKISAVTKGRFDPTEYKVVKPAHTTKALRFVKRGDFLFSRANTVELVAACCIVPKDYDRLFLPDKLWILTLNTKLLDAQFFNYLLKNERYRDEVRSLASGGHDSMLNISMKKFMALNVPCPPIHIQKDFSSIVEKVETLKSLYQKSLTELENLYGTLSQKAFKGELDLSRVPLPVVPIQGEVPFSLKASETLPVAPQIDFPESYLLQSDAKSIDRKEILKKWFKFYIDQLGDRPFSIQSFLDEAQTQFTDRHPDLEITLGMEEYEQIKAWVFEVLDSGRLRQERNQVYCVIKNKETVLGNLIELKASQT